MGIHWHVLRIMSKLLSVMNVSHALHSEAPSCLCPSSYTVPPMPARLHLHSAVKPLLIYRWPTLHFSSVYLHITVNLLLYYCSSTAHFHLAFVSILWFHLTHHFLFTYFLPFPESVWSGRNTLPCTLSSLHGYKTAMHICMHVWLDTQTHARMHNDNPPLLHTLLLMPITDVNALTGSI